jgi:serine/threonine protein kinase
MRGAKNAAPSADIFSFGVMAHELLTGERPFGDAPACTVMLGDAVAAPALRGRVAGLPDGAAELLDRCLAADPAARPTAAELAYALAA